MKRSILLTLFIIFLGLFAWAMIQAFLWYQSGSEDREADKRQRELINNFLSERQQTIDSEESESIFGDRDEVNVLLIGLDKRAGQEAGHCDAIQLFTINKETKKVTITAVPRGTYSTLPPGTAVTSSDYYVSNSCALGGFEYGIKQIEKILGTKADYLVVVGFSETLGILRNFQLPTTETLQWLRNRRAYSVGEPQRAHNHSTFLKEMLVRFLPDDESKVDSVLHYIIYRMVQTDLSFAQAEEFVSVLTDMDIKHHPDNIVLQMKPFYNVQDIPYDEDTISEHLAHTIGAISNLISKDDYSGASLEDTQDTLLQIIEEKKDDDEFVVWAFENNVWLQVEDEEKRNEIHFDFLRRYLNLQEDKQTREDLVSDYVLEMDHKDLDLWARRGEVLLLKELD